MRLAVEGLARDLGLAPSTAALSDHLVELFGRAPEPWRQSPPDPAIPDPVLPEPTSRRLVLPLPADDPAAGVLDDDDSQAVPRPISVEQTLPTPPAPIEFDLVSVEFIPPPQPRPWRWLLLAAVLVGALALWWL